MYLHFSLYSIVIDMEKLKLLFWLVQVTVVIGTCNGQCPFSAVNKEPCKVETNNSREISYSSECNEGTKCWIIKVPEGSSVRLDVANLELNGWSCESNYLEIFVTGLSYQYKFCSYNSTRPIVTARKDVQIRFTYLIQYKIYRASFSMRYNIETKFPFVPGLREIKDASILKLRNQFSTDFGWGKNIHRAITALYLSGNASFHNDTSPDELMTKQLGLQTAAALLRNSSYSDQVIPLTELSMFINALTATCYKPRYNLLQILSERLTVSKSPNPGAYLTLCNANWTLPLYQTESLFRDLEEPSKYPFRLDTEAMTIMALTCAMNKTGDFFKIQNGYRIYNTSIHRLISEQRQDGSFGNVYTTALVTQALLASGQENNPSWNWKATLQFLIKELNATSDFLSISLTLPIFNGKTLLDLANVNCTQQRKHGEGEEILEIMSKLGRKISVDYSLYLDWYRSYSIVTLFVPENSSAFDVIKVAQVANRNYRFRYQYVSNQPYVFEIAGLKNDPEAQKYWFLYVENYPMQTRLVNQSFDNLIVKDGDRLTMWFRSIDIKSDFFLTTPYQWSTYPWTYEPGTGYPSTHRPETSYPWSDRPGTGYRSTDGPGTE